MFCSSSSNRCQDGATGSSCKVRLPLAILVIVVEICRARLAASSDPDFAIWKAEASVVHFDGNWTPPDGVADKFDSLSTVRLPKDLTQYKLVSRSPFSLSQGTS